jgi:hypothetical protein
MTCFAMGPHKYVCTDTRIIFVQESHSKEIKYDGVCNTHIHHINSSHDLHSNLYMPSTKLFMVMVVKLCILTCMSSDVLINQYY